MLFFVVFVVLCRSFCCRCCHGCCLPPRPFVLLLFTFVVFRVLFFSLFAFVVVYERRPLKQTNKEIKSMTNLFVEDPSFA